VWQLPYSHCPRCQTTRWYPGDSPTDPAQALSLPEVPPTLALHNACAGYSCVWCATRTGSTANVIRSSPG
jgi:hypothetical protein